MNIAQAPAVVTVGKFTGGVRSNIIPDKVELVGTVRAFDDDDAQGHPRAASRDIATKYAEAAGATATVDLGARLPGDHATTRAHRDDGADAAPRRRRRQRWSSDR